MRKCTWGFVLAIAFMLIGASGVSANHIPHYTGFINDFAKVLKTDTVVGLNTMLATYQKATGHEIAVATVATLNGEVIDTFAVKTFEEWKIGKRGADDGVLLVLAITERKVRLEVGYGAEAVLTDAQAGDIIRQITPRLQAQDYDAAVKEAVSAVKLRLDMLEKSTGQKKVDNSGGTSWGLILLVSLGLLLVGGVVYMRRMSDVSAPPPEAPNSAANTLSTTTKRRRKKTSEDWAPSNSWSSAADSESSSSSSESTRLGGGTSGGGGASGSW